MDFSTTKTQAALIDHARQAAKAFDPALAPAGRGFWPAAGAEGWLGLCLDRDHGGQGLGAVDTVLVAEALGRGGLSRAALFSMGAHLFGCAMALQNHAGPALRAAWLPRLASGAAIGALALTEPQGGSDTGNGRVLVAFDADGPGLTLTGTKTLVSNGPLADLLVVNATRQGATSALQSSVLAVPTDLPGLRVTPLTGHIGLREAPMAEIHFDNVRLDRDHVLGRPGQGLGILLSVMRWERSCILAGFLGAAERDLVAVTRALSGRQNSRGPLIAQQAVAHALAELRVEQEMARLLLYRGAGALEANEGAVIYPAMAKLAISRALVSSARGLQELMAGAGWLDEMGLATALTDVMGTLSASGTSHIQLNAIASGLER